MQQRVSETIHFPQPRTDFPMRDAGACSVDHTLVHVLVAAFGGALQCIERGFNLLLVTACLEVLQPLELRFHHLARRWFQRLALHLLGLRHPILVDPHHRLSPAVDFLRERQGRIPANLLRDARLRRRVHAAGRIDAGDYLANLRLHLVGQRFDIVGAA
jgi:hypothetical protein